MKTKRKALRLQLAGLITAALQLISAPSRGDSPDGLLWTKQVSGTSNILYSVSAVDKNFAVATGANATVLLYDGTSWKPFPGFSEFYSENQGWNAAKDIRVSAVANASTIYIGAYDSNNGKVAYWNGSQWQNINTGTGRRVTSLWASGPDLILAGRISGYMARFSDGLFKGHVVSGNLGDHTIGSISGSGEDNIWATGSSRSLLHSTDSGISWTQVDTPATGSIVPLFSLSTTQNWFTSEKDLFFYDGESFNLLHTFDETIRNLYALSEDEIWVVGTNGLVSYFNGTAWTGLELGAGDWHSINGVGTDLWLVGSGGQIFMASIPEPSTTLACLMGGIALVAMGHRRTRHTV